jgi:hypothetical protein
MAQLALDGGSQLDIGMFTLGDSRGRGCGFPRFPAFLERLRIYATPPRHQNPVSAAGAA